MASGGSSEQKSQTVAPIFANPLGGVFNNLFGVPVAYNKGRGGFQVGGTPGARGPQSKLDFANQLFSPGSFDVLGDQLEPTGTNIFQGQALSGLDRALGLFDETLLPGVNELATTGFRPNTEAIRADELRKFNREFLPGLTEQFSFLGGGGQDFSSDFGAAAANAGADLFSDLGRLEFDADTFAAQNRITGLGLGADLATQFAQLPIGIGSDLFTLEEQARESELANRPGGQLLSFLDRLSAIVERDPIVQANVSKGKSAQGGVL